MAEKNNNKDIMKNFLAVTEDYAAAKKFGIKEDNIIKIWNWIGGRYSLWTGVSIGLIIAVGFNNFSRFLKGANKGDKHFLIENTKKIFR